MIFIYQSSSTLFNIFFWREKTVGYIWGFSPFSLFSGKLWLRGVQWSSCMDLLLLYSLHKIIMKFFPQIIINCTIMEMKELGLNDNRYNEDSKKYCF